MPTRDDARALDQEPDIDAAGVDRVQIRDFLALSAAQRLRRLEAQVEAILEIRERNRNGQPASVARDETAHRSGSIGE